MNRKELIKNVLVLFLLCLCMGTVLCIVNQLTSEPIKAKERKEILIDRNKLLPADEYIDLFHDENRRLDNDLLTKLKDRHISNLVKAIKDGKFAGYIVETSLNAKSGVFVIMYSLSPKYEILDLYIKKQQQTLGSDDKINSEQFISKFKGKTLDELVLSETQEVSKLQSSTTNTISSREVTETIHDSLKAVIETIREQVSRKKFSFGNLNLNLDLFGSKVYAQTPKVNPKLAELLPADDYQQVMPCAYRALKKGKPVGYVAQATGQGYGGPMIIFYATDLNLKLTKVVINKHQETPSYAEKIVKPEFLDQFKGKTAENLVLKKNAKKSPEYISAVTRATISSKAVVDAVKDSLEKLKKAVKN